MAEGVHVTAEHNTVEPLHDARESYLANIQWRSHRRMSMNYCRAVPLSFENAVAFVNDIF